MYHISKIFLIYKMDIWTIVVTGQTIFGGAITGAIGVKGFKTVVDEEDDLHCILSKTFCHCSRI